MKPDPKPRPGTGAASLARQVCAQLDVNSVGLGFAVVIALFVFGLAPTVVAVGLVALLVVD